MFELIGELFTFIKEIIVSIFSILSSTIVFIFGSISTLHTEMPRIEGALIAMLAMWVVLNKSKYSILRKMFIPIDLAIAAAEPYLEAAAATMRKPAAWSVSTIQRLAYAVSSFSRTLWNRVISRLK